MPPKSQTVPPLATPHTVKDAVYISFGLQAIVASQGLKKALEMLDVPMLELEKQEKQTGLNLEERRAMSFLQARYQELALTPGKSTVKGDKAIMERARLCCFALAAKPISDIPSSGVPRSDATVKYLGASNWINHMFDIYRDIEEPLLPHGVGWVFTSSFENMFWLSHQLLLLHRDPHLIEKIITKLPSGHTVQKKLDMHVSLEILRLALETMPPLPARPSKDAKEEILHLKFLYGTILISDAPRSFSMNDEQKKAVAMLKDCIAENYRVQMCKFCIDEVERQVNFLKDDVDSGAVIKCGHCAVKDTSTKLKKCSRCQVTYYCGSDCQKKHWSSHKGFCNVMASSGDVPTATVEHQLPEKLECGVSFSDRQGIKERYGLQEVTGLKNNLSSVDTSSKDKAFLLVNGKTLSTKGWYSFFFHRLKAHKREVLRRIHAYFDYQTQFNSWDKVLVCPLCGQGCREGFILMQGEIEFSSKLSHRQRLFPRLTHDKCLDRVASSLYYTDESGMVDGFLNEFKDYIVTHEEFDEVFLNLFNKATPLQTMCIEKVQP